MLPVLPRFIYSVTPMEWSSDPGPGISGRVAPPGMTSTNSLNEPGRVELQLAVNTDSDHWGRGGRFLLSKIDLNIEQWWGIGSVVTSASVTS